MIDLQALTYQIRKNCSISDAKFWGTYSLCSFLIRLRDLYRFEKRIKPWKKIDQKDIGEWITEKEHLWKKLADTDIEDIGIDSISYNPFEVSKINVELTKEGLIYGAGYGIHMKPSFFLANLISKKSAEGYEIYISGEEYVKDLSAYPAMLQDRTIFIRKELMTLYFWEKFNEFRSKRSKTDLAFSFSRYSIQPEEEPSENIYKKIAHIADSEVESYIYHEVGEALEGEELGDEWTSFLRDVSSHKAELFVRSVKDILSDTSEKGMLKHIIENKKEGSLGFYIVSLSGYRKILFPEITDAFQQFIDSKNWTHIEDARNRGYKKAKMYAGRLLSIYQKNLSNKDLISQYIEQEIPNRL